MFDDWRVLVLIDFTASLNYLRQKIPYLSSNFSCITQHYTVNYLYIRWIDDFDQYFDQFIEPIKFILRFLRLNHLFTINTEAILYIIQQNLTETSTLMTLKQFPQHFDR